MQELVSIIIPCFNKGKWLQETLESCFSQTYSPLEIIVIDDGSTDNSLEIIQKYSDKLTWETGLNRGANHARNRGFELSSGTYIQYLDADDYLFPDKIEKQVHFLETTGVDVVYGDEKHLTYLPDGRVKSEIIKLDGLQEDILELFLSCQAFIQTANPLFRREVVAKSSGWDETLKAAQDIDFFRSVAINRAKFRYQPGCCLLYRKYESNDRITCNLANVWTSRLFVTEKVEKKLVQLNMLTTQYKKALALFYYEIALFGCSYFNYQQYLSLLKRIRILDPSVSPDHSRFRNGSSIHNLLNNVFGFVLAGVIYKFLKDFRRMTLSRRKIPS